MDERTFPSAVVGLVSHRTRRTFRVDGSGMSRGVATGTATHGWYRCGSWCALDNAIVGIDLADRKQMLVVTNHDSKVLAVHVPVQGMDLGSALDWAAERAAARGASRG